MNSWCTCLFISTSYCAVLCSVYFRHLCGAFYPPKDYCRKSIGRRSLYSKIPGMRKYKCREVITLLYDSSVISFQFSGFHFSKNRTNASIVSHISRSEQGSVSVFYQGSAQDPIPASKSKRWWRQQLMNIHIIHHIIGRSDWSCDRSRRQLHRISGRATLGATGRCDDRCDGRIAWRRVEIRIAVAYGRCGWWTSALNIR